tara:strand:+ start:776 stop:940 length:165 start_codon:yes stop_codon:yes gene_type:complete
MQLLSFGNFYLGKDKESFVKFDIHLGRYRLEYERPNFNKDDGAKPSEETNRRQD